MDSILDMGDETPDMFEYPLGDIPAIKTPMVIPVEFPEYSPLEQDVFTMWEVVDQLASAANAFSELELVLSQAAPEQLSDDSDKDIVFRFVEALNIFASDCHGVAKDLINFSEYVEKLLFGERQVTLAPVRVLPRGSFSERDMKEVLESAAKLPKEEVAQALAALEIDVPISPMGSQRSQEGPPTLKLSTSDIVLLPLRMPHSRQQSVGAVGRFSERTDKQDMVRKHRGYVVYGEVRSVFAIVYKLLNVILGNVCVCGGQLVGEEHCGLWCGFSLR